MGSVEQDASFTCAAVRQFDLRAREILEGLGVRPTQDYIARVLGTPTSTYANLLAGRQRLSVDLLGDWLRAWNARMPPLAFYLDHTGVLLIRAVDLADALSYEGPDVLGEMGRRFLVGPRGALEVDAVEFVGDVWVPRGRVGLVGHNVAGWAYHTPEIPAPGGRSAVRIYFEDGRDTVVAYVDGPALMRALRIPSARRPDVPLVG